jgi:hypothetical protein
MPEFTPTVPFPADLPHILHWRLRSTYRCRGAHHDKGVTVRVTMPRRPVHFVGNGGNTNAAETCAVIPPGADAWRLAGGEWQPMELLPASWRPYLDRARPSEMDPRPDPRK